jgi:hypothetical protein
MTAQTSGNPAATVAAATTTAQVPRLVRFSGTLTSVTDNAAGAVVTAPSSDVGVTFSLYAEQTGGAPLWSEVQNVQLDKTGHYTVQLGSTKPDGLPVDLFASAQAQWLGVRVEAQAEQPRIMLLSVPYALKAADAETFGGKPPSAFMPSSSSDGSAAAGRSGLNPNVKNDHPLGLTGSGTTNYVPLWTSASNLASSAIYQDPAHGNLGIGTTTPGAKLDVHDNTSMFVVSGTTTDSTEVGVAGQNLATSGSGVGTGGHTTGPTGIGVFGVHNSLTGAGIGVSGLTYSPAGVGVSGVANTQTGLAIGVSGSSASSDGVGVYGLATATGTLGNAYGVKGQAANPDGAGGFFGNSATTGQAVGVGAFTHSSAGFAVVGIGITPSNTGVGGQGVPVGVWGDSSEQPSVGVLGTVDNGIASVGLNNSTASPAGYFENENEAASATAAGVEGKSSSPTGTGVYGINTATTGSAFGVSALTVSTGGISMYAVAVEPSVTTGAARPVAVWGSTNQSGAVAVAGTADDGYAIGGANYSVNSATARFENQEADDPSGLVVRTVGTAFDGSCFIDVSGDLLCTGTVSGGTLVDNGTRRVALYAVEAPENWFEDAGSALLANGSAVVHLESIFAQTVNSGVEYHVFLTPKGDCKGLYVTNETAESFEVRELGGGTTNIAFDYRIMARRKGYENVRLADKTERFAKSAAQDRQMQRTQPKLPAKTSPAGGAAQPPRCRGLSQAFPLPRGCGVRSPMHPAGYR